MRGLSDAAVMDLWEQGRLRHPIDRALLLFAAAEPELPRETLADLPVGRRDAAILSLRNESFGARIDGYGQCPACSERYEFALDGAALHAAAPPAAAAEFADADGRRLRLPTSRDLAALVQFADLDDAAQALAEVCMPDGASPDPDSIAALLAQHDPAADLSLALSCEACAHRWELAFDPASYCWEEIEARAARLFDQVHGLARAYGWSEAEVLRLSPARRNAYLERCAA